MSYDQQTPPPPPFVEQPPPAQEQGTSGLAIAGLILAFLIAPLGFILSLIAVFKTGPGRKKGRGLAIAGLIISVLIIGGGVAVGVAVSGSTVADPGCTTGKAAILDNADTVNATSLQATIDGLNSATAKAKHDNVKAATKALADDYTEVLKATKTGNAPAGLQAKLTADANTLDSLCTVGS
jgi:hypothetical protein